MAWPCSCDDRVLLAIALLATLELLVLLAGIVAFVRLRAVLHNVVARAVLEEAARARVSTSACEECGAPTLH